MMSIKEDRSCEMFALLAMDEMIARLLLIYGFKVVQEIMKLAEFKA